MRCDRFREAVSARLDGEPLGMSTSTLDAHLASCPDCARWTSATERLTRLTRMDAVEVPDLVPSIELSVVRPARRVLRRRHVLRFALAVTGIVQLLIGLPALTGENVGMAMSAHGNHESAAWNLAIGIALVAVASVPRRAAGLIPLLGTFMVVLGALSVHDIAAGSVTPERLATHLAALAGLVLLIALDRAERALPPGRASGLRSGATGRRHPAFDDGDSNDDPDDGPTGLRTVA